MKSSPKFVQWWSAVNRWRQSSRALKQAHLAQEAEHHLWMPTPNLYRSKDLGYQTVCGQRVKARRVSDTSGLSFLILDDSFKVS